MTDPDDTLWLHLVSKHGPPRAVLWGPEHSRRWHHLEHENEVAVMAVSVDYVPHAAGDLTYDLALARKVLADHLDSVDPLPPEYESDRQ